MSEANGTAEKQFAIQRIYTKDISFETPNAPIIFTQKWEPSVELNLGTQVQPLDNAMFEVVLTLTVTVKTADSVAYLVEIKQAGIFLMGGFTDQELGPMLGIVCPATLFPYAREAVSDLVTKGSFPQLILAPVNFDALYVQHLQQAQQSLEPQTLN